MADLNITAEFSDLQLLRRELIDIEKKAKDSASIFEREYKRVERQLQRSAAAHQKYYKEVQQANLANKSASQSASVFSQELQKQENRLDTLRAKYNPLYAASKQYERALEEINEAQRIGALNDKQREAALESLHQEFATGTGQFAKYAAASGQMRQGLARSSVAMQQFGYQAGDFIVQVQSGTNAFVAFGQQATQLAGLLTMSMNPKIIALGAALSIIIPLATAAGAAFMRTRDGAEQATSRLDQIDEALKEYQQTLEAAAQGMTLDELFSTNELERAQRQLGSLQQDLQSLVELNPLAIMSEGLRDTLKRFTFGIVDITLPELVSQAEAVVEQAQARVDAIRQRQEAEAAQRRAEFAADTEADLRNQIALMQVQVRYGEDSAQAQAEIARQARLAFEAELMREGIQDDQLENIMAQYREYEKLNQIMRLAAMMPKAEDSEDPDTGTGGGAVRDSIGGLARSLMTEQEQIDAWRTESLEKLQEFNALELEVLGGHANARARIEEEYQNRIRELREQQYQGVVDSQKAAQSAFLGLLGTLGQKSQTAAKLLIAINTGLSIAQAIQNTAVAATRALAELGPVAGAAAAAKIKAFGAAQVALIAANGALRIGSAGASGAGGGSIGGSGDVAAPVAAAAPEPQQVIIEGIDRDSLISGEQLSKLFDRLYEENDERGIVFSVAR
jgi:hypothetical protein